MMLRPQRTVEAGGAPGTARSYAVLPVDDSKVLHAIVARYLDGTEFAVAGRALDGDEALDRCREVNPDVIILDMVMPGPSGQETLANILRWNRRTRVVMASAVGTQDLVHDCLAAGASGFIVKPFSRDDLIGCLRRTVAAA